MPVSPRTTVAQQRRAMSMGLISLWYQRICQDMEETQISAATVLDKLNMLLQCVLTFYEGLALGDVEDADCVCVVQFCLGLRFFLTGEATLETLQEQHMVEINPGSLPRKREFTLAPQGFIEESKAWRLLCFVHHSKWESSYTTMDLCCNTLRWLGTQHLTEEWSEAVELRAQPDVQKALSRMEAWFFDCQLILRGACFVKQTEGDKLLPPSPVASPSSGSDVATDDDAETLVLGQTPELTAILSLGPSDIILGELD